MKAMSIVAAALVLATVAMADADPKALHALYAASAERLRESPFGRPLWLASSEADGRLEGEIRAVVVVNLLPDLAVTPRFRGKETEPAVARLTIEFNAVLARQGRRYGVEVIDLYGPSRVEVPRRPELLAADGYHPSDLGYARWAELLWAGVERHILVRVRL